MSIHQDLLEAGAEFTEEDKRPSKRPPYRLFDALWSLFSNVDGFRKAVEAQVRPKIQEGMAADIALASGLAELFAGAITEATGMSREALGTLSRQGATKDMLAPEAMIVDWGESQLTQDLRLTLRGSWAIKSEGSYRIELERNLLVSWEPAAGRITFHREIRA